MHNSKYDFQEHPIFIYGMHAILHKKIIGQLGLNHSVDDFTSAHKSITSDANNFIYNPKKEFTLLKQCNDFYEHSNSPEEV